MKKKLFIVALFLVLTLVLTGCACKHEWVEATCTLPKTCQKCEEVEGEALGHTWVDADCVTPKTCSVCAATESEALGHTWVDADCVTPKTCSVCAATEGEALGHTFVDADCVTPKTCTVCAATEGEALGHTFADATCEAPETCINCAATKGEKLEHTITDWAVQGNQAVRKCASCGLVAFSKDLELKSGVEMKFVRLDDSLLIPVPAAWQTENLPSHIVLDNELYTAMDPQTGYFVAITKVTGLGEVDVSEYSFRMAVSNQYKTAGCRTNHFGFDYIFAEYHDDWMELFLLPDGKGNEYVFQFAQTEWKPVVDVEEYCAISNDIITNCFVEN